MTTEYPWLELALARLVALRTTGRLPHALLITGPAGTGKSVLARRLAEVLLCPHPDGIAACGSCTACAQLAAGSHPDFQFVTIESDDRTGRQKTAIVVDQVRALIERLALGSHAGGMKIVLVSPADALNINAANSLLKTLEEPSDNTVLVLVSDRPARLPATIRSRCQQVRVDRPPREQALEWLTGQFDDPEQAARALDVAAGAPLAARALLDADVMGLRRERAGQLLRLVSGKVSATELASQWAEDEGLYGIHWMRDWTMDLLRLKLTGQQVVVRNTDVADSLSRLVDGLTVRLLFRQLDVINSLLRTEGTSLNRLLMTEDILLGWVPGNMN